MLNNDYKICIEDSTISKTTLVAACSIMSLEKRKRGSENGINSAVFMTYNNVLKLS